VVDALIAAHQVEVPEALVLRQVAHQIEHARDGIRRQGLDPDRLPWDYEKLMADLKPGGERAVRRALLLEAVAETEGIAADETEVDAEVERFARAGQRPAPAVRRMMEQSGDLETLRLGIRERRTLDLLIEHAQIAA
jgi:trigger factor